MGGAVTEPFDIYVANVANVEGNFFDPTIKEWVYSKMWLPETGEYGEPPKTKQVYGQDAAPAAAPDQMELLVDDWNTNFEEAVGQYIDGDWPTATAGLQACLAERPWATGLN